ncbi:hypothetical protein DICPUDRAFT_28422 [Dictyostelium purpureum]|uniref:Dihydropteridine reductase n=1 Tax=Dictyostelium purpureum TaxID=5786 RepID=F0ZBZ1_DICPU|nr:uncharacterized protein DICPUDRAFT_28422 [Dictyostelium purpureum]EGC38570.1 hypothetical protein DICPUDRAFT_28422 [Dictyostelium purpureum]|eukprot:XP_003284941.1 hypothetical protein DICPUDRAFT_28422 [Dictyostelium purpureum]
MSKNLLVLGGSGSLGAEIVKFFKTNGWNTISVDFRDSPSADLSLTIKDSGEEEINSVIEKINSKQLRIDTFVCAAGGWTGGDASTDGYLSSVKKMIDMNLYSALAAARLGSKLLNEGGLFVLTGAAAALNNTPFMIAYGATKAATHHIVKDLACPNGGLPAKSISVGILPVTLDTPSNRSGMPNANFDDWTPLEEVATKLYEWSSKSESRPTNGSLIKFETKSKVTSWINV